MVCLSDDDIQFFIDEGYLIKRNVLNSDLMAQARESLWANAPEKLDRDDPESWIGPFETMSDDRDSVRHGFTWKYRRQGSEDWMIRLLAKDPSVWAMAEQLLGTGNLMEPERVRGIYCILPEGEAPERPYGFHVDRHPFHLGVVAYIDDVVPNGGGFAVLPQSHRTFYYDFHTQYTMEPTDTLKKHIWQLCQKPYVDCHGQAGDIIFWHHRLGHSAGHNRSKNIRQAVLYDYRRRDLDDLLDSSPQPDMWRDWPGVKAYLARADEKAG
ncbi:MAG: phytanoyl-CoA dioxygenase family protein [Chloroflexota bacterium]